MKNKTKNNNSITNEFVSVIKTNKYKNINLYLRFCVENKNLVKEKMCLLSEIIGMVTNKFNTKELVTKEKDMLYGFDYNSSVKVVSNLIVLNLNFSFVNPKYVDVTTEEYNAFIKEILFNTLINEKTLDEAKRNVKAKIQRRLEKPIDNATQKFIDIVSKDNPDFSAYGFDNNFFNNLEKISVDDLINMYRFVINKAQLNVYLSGDLTQEDIDILATYVFANRIRVSLKTKKMKIKKKKMLVDIMPIGQSYLLSVYSAPVNRFSKEYYAWKLANSFFGSLPTSLLFDELREKQSLCYSVSSSLYSYEGLARVITCIDSKNKDKVVKSIETQIKKLCSKDYDVSKLDASKKLLCSVLMEMNDDLDLLVDFKYEQFLADEKLSLEDICTKFNKVTPNDISKIYKKYVNYFNYILLGTAK